MSLTDPIANYLTLLRNAIQAKRQKVDIPSSNLLVEITKLLKDEGYINNYKVTEEGSKTILRVYLKYGSKGERVISGLQRISLPVCRTYTSCKSIRRVLGGLGISILTTPKGVLSGAEARKQGVGGEILCNVW
jgi:small subunit ribosomal protein S8